MPEHPNEKAPAQPGLTPFSPAAKPPVENPAAPEGEIWPVFDSHAHYDDPAFDPDRDALLASLPGKGVVGILNPGTSVAGSLLARKIAERFPPAFCAAGIHPEEAVSAQPGDVKRIGELCAHPKCVAIGEIGLDYHYDIPRDVQLRLFEEQLALAKELDKPVIIHDREAHADTMELLRRYRPRGVMHCYSGSAEMARELLSLGFYISFTGVITFKNARRAVEAAQAVPAERLLLETDAPYMSPEPVRGVRCDSSMVQFILRRVAEIKGLPIDEASALFIRNTRELFGLPEN